MDLEAERNRRLEEEVKGLRKDLSDAHLAALELRLSQCEKLVDRFGRAEETRQANIEIVLARNEATYQQYRGYELDNFVEEKDAEISELSEAVNNLQAELDNALNTRDVEVLNEELQAARTELKDVKRRHKAQDGELNRQVEELREEVEELNAIQDNQDAEIKKQRKERRELERAWEAEKQMLEEEIEDLKARLASANTQRHAFPRQPASPHVDEDVQPSKANPTNMRQQHASPKTVAPTAQPPKASKARSTKNASVKRRPSPPPPAEARTEPERDEEEVPAALGPPIELGDTDDDDSGGNKKADETAVIQEDAQSQQPKKKKRKIFGGAKAAPAQTFKWDAADVSFDPSMGLPLNLSPIKANPHAIQDPSSVGARGQGSKLGRGGGGIGRMVGLGGSRGGPFGRGRG